MICFSFKTSLLEVWYRQACASVVCYFFEAGLEETGLLVFCCFGGFMQVTCLCSFLTGLKLCRQAYASGLVTSSLL